MYSSESSEKLQKCSFCDYYTTKGYNLKRHIQRRHKPEEERLPQNETNLLKSVTTELKNVTTELKNVTPELKNVTPELKNVTILPQNETNENDAEKSFVCDKCLREFTRNSNMQRHMASCKKKPCNDIKVLSNQYLWSSLGF